MCGYDYTRSCKLMLFWETRCYQPQTRNGQGMRIYSVHYARNWNSFVETISPSLWARCLPQHAHFFSVFLTVARNISRLQFCDISEFPFWSAQKVPVKPQQYFCSFALTPDLSFTNSLQSIKLQVGNSLFRLRDEPDGNHGSRIHLIGLDICFDEYNYHDSL